MGDLRSGLNELERLVAGGEEPAMLLAQLLGQMELATVAAAAGGKNSDAVARDLGAVAPGRLSSVMNATRQQAPGSFAQPQPGLWRTATSKPDVFASQRTRCASSFCRSQCSRQNDQMAARIEPP